MDVLVVEDNRADGELLAEALAEADPGADCVITATPDGCLELLRTRRWDLILVDLRLGPHDGHLLLERLHESRLHREASLYVLTSSVAPEDVERAKRQSIHGYLRKPFTFDGWLELARCLTAGDERRMAPLLR